MNNMTTYIIQTLMSIPGFIIFFAFRGFFQAYVARKLGDETPTNDGFLTMNPLAHINIIGFICLLLVGFGFGKPIRFNSRNYKHPKRDAAIQVLSAPASGLILAFVLAFILFLINVLGNFNNFAANRAFVILFQIFSFAFSITLSLTVFLFLPLPGFDSYRLIANFLPYNYYRKLYTIEKYSLFIFFGFILLLRVPVIGTAISYVLIELPVSFLSIITAGPWNLLYNLIFH